MYGEDFSALWLRRLAVVGALTAGLLATIVGFAALSPPEIVCSELDCEGWVWVQVAAFGTAAACGAIAYALWRRWNSLAWAGLIAAAVFMSGGYLAGS